MYFMQKYQKAAHAGQVDKAAADLALRH